MLNAEAARLMDKLSRPGGCSGMNKRRMAWPFCGQNYASSVARPRTGKATILTSPNKGLLHIALAELLGAA